MTSADPFALFDRRAWRLHRDRAARSGCVDFLHSEVADRIIDRAHHNIACAEMTVMHSFTDEAKAAALDEFDVPNPSVADLQDPTLDAFLGQLEREPSIEAQLGLPERPRGACHSRAEDLAARPEDAACLVVGCIGGRGG